VAGKFQYRWRLEGDRNVVNLQGMNDDDSVMSNEIFEGIGDFGCLSWFCRLWKAA
jgi:hypothetical protein